MKSGIGKKLTSENAKEIEQWLLEQEWLSYGVELPIIRRFWQETFKSRPKMKPSFVMPSLHAILKAVELNCGISMLRDYLCREAVRQKRVTVLVNPPKPVRNEIWLAYRKVEGKHPLIKEFRKQFERNGIKVTPSDSSKAG